MGFINKAKGDFAAKEARNAIEKGRSVFVYRIIEAMTNSMTTGALTGVNDQIEDIEREGWRLEHLSVGEGKAITGERVAIICLFRRALKA
ncbi:hypothetical protein O3S80_29170 [Streptomyces sp. Lzd4kr]|nr:hypothetical protein [Streptomyces sp. Lzd4kr]